MKTRIILLLSIVFYLYSCKLTSEDKNTFKAKQISKTASFIVNTDVNTAFLLFGAFEERKWAPHWSPVLIYPNKEVIKEGTTFKIEGHGHGHDEERKYLWIVTRYDLPNHHIQYLVSTENRFWTITITCSKTEHPLKTKAAVTYTYTGLNTKGNLLNEKNCKHMFKNNLKDWSDAINGYLQTTPK